MQKKTIAIIGSNGIPAKYGGFETLAENLVKNLNSKYNFIVYCSTIYGKHEKVNFYKNTKLVYLPFKANGVQSLFYDFFSFFHALFFSKTILFLGPTSSGIITLFNFFFNRKIIVNHGGLNEWEREKYTHIEKKWAKLNHKLAAKCASINITDNTLLQKSLLETFKANSLIIRYGGNHNDKINVGRDILKDYPFLNQKYYLCVARAQVDNNIHLLINAFKGINSYPLVVISNWNISKYGKDIIKENKDNPNLILIDAIYDIGVLNEIRKNCYVYIHTHSYCGTAPSLVEVMNLKVPIICFDVPTNRETTHNQSFYFNSIKSLADIICKINSKQLIQCKKNMFKIARQEYNWKKVSKEYSNIF